MLDIPPGRVLTFMSIDELILDRVKRGMLYPLVPYAPGARADRAMFLCEALWAILESPEGDDEWEVRVGELRADLERFVTNEEPIDPKYLFLLYPAADAVWEIRSVRPDPSIRVLGSFAKTDVFIATNHALRAELGGWQSRAWKEVKRAAVAIWRQIFHSYRPIKASNIRDVVTGAHNGEYFRDSTNQT